VNCPNGACPIQVPAPGAALVFLTSASFSESVPEDSAVHTFQTTYTSRRHSTATLAQVVIETSNGINGGLRQTLASTSFGSIGEAARENVPRWAGVLAAVLAVGVGIIAMR